MNIKMENDNSSATKIKVLGVGGGGCNAINRMIEKGFRDLEFIAINTDVQVLANSKANKKIQIGSNLTRGLGAGANPEVGEKAALESKEAIKEAIEGSDMIFITAGMGGGTGTGASPVIAQIARELNILTIAVITKPFVFEGNIRMKQATEGIEKLKKYVDSIIIVPNEKLLEISKEKFTLLDSFAYADDILRQSIQGISDIINKTGVINVDFADVKVVMQNSGYAIMGIGQGSGQNRVERALQMCINNPLLDVDIEGAKGILVNVTGGKDFGVHEYNQIVSAITRKAHTEAKIIAGFIYDESLQDSISITIIATNFEERKPKTNKIEKEIKDTKIKAIESTIESSFDNYLKEFQKKDKFDLIEEDMNTLDEIPTIMRIK